MSRWMLRASWLLALLLALALVTTIARIASGGVLDPPGAPAPTMKTLDDVPPSWGQTLSASGADACATDRFRCVLSGAGVLDLETGLVWERAPNTLLPTQDWAPAMNLCTSRLAGGRYGWRLPTVVEFKSLIQDGQLAPALPAGHPFDVTGLESEIFWTATIDASNAGRDN